MKSVQFQCHEVIAGRSGEDQPAERAGPAAAAFAGPAGGAPAPAFGGAYPPDLADEPVAALNAALPERAKFGDR